VILEHSVLGLHTCLVPVLLSSPLLSCIPCLGSALQYILCACLVHSFPVCITSTSIPASLRCTCFDIARQILSTPCRHSGQTPHRPRRTLRPTDRNTGQLHWEAVKRVLRYLSGTKDHALTYGNERHELLGFTDADGASQEHRHAVSGYAFLIDGAAVSWASRKQEIITLSTTEAEYVAATHAAKESIWLRRFTESLFGPIPTPTTLYCDNQAAIHLATDDNYHTRTKHIDIHFHFIRQTITNGHIDIKYCPTEDMTADILTKALPKFKVALHSLTLGICCP
jgi:hypothetical protein